MSGTNPEKPPIQPEQQLYPHPTADDTHHQQQQQPPQYASGPTQYNPDQKSELPGSNVNQGQAQYFPPPPPGPPPANQPQFTHAPQPQQPQQHHQQHTDPTAPGYNPADLGAGRHYAPFDGPPGSSPAAPGHPQGENPYADPAAAHAAYIAPVDTPDQKGKKGWGERLSQIGMKAAVPINALANKMGSQSFLPTTMDKECEKAAKILRSFCKDGIASDVPGSHGAAQPTTTTTTKDKARKEQKAIVKIPSKVINKAVGLAIFTTARAGFNFSGATGSGVLVSRLPDGSWSPPSGIQVHALGAGFMIGIDIYDCVCVINSRDALAAFTGTRVSLGPDVAVVAGPYGAGGTLDVGASFGGRHPPAEDGDKTAAAAAEQADAKPSVADDGKLRPDEKHKRRSSSSSIKPVFSYVKSRGFYAGIQVDGTVVTERKDANAAFYGQKVTVDQIIKGQVPPQGPAGMWPMGAQALYEALRTAEQQKPLPEVHLPQATPGQIPPQGSIPQQQQQQQQYGGGRPEGTGIPTYGQPQYTHPEGGPLRSHPTGQGPTASGALGREEQLPGYVEDGVARPGVGDHKTQYQ
ncbi:hypothetical protein LX36DRAFT_675456 [Colletotrichum falcatum]|nr:hypothetical protein LX36DRAFT_675456 [Colletotrichum falcatum]